jgi:hypothetical protein
MMKQNEDRSLNSSNKNVTLIAPDFGELDFYSFSEVDKLCDIGYEKAREVLS